MHCMLFVYLMTCMVVIPFCLWASHRPHETPFSRYRAKVSLSRSCQHSRYDFAKRKLNLILRSQVTFVTFDPVVKEGDRSQVYDCSRKEIIDSWLSLRTVLETDTKSGTVTVAGSNCHNIVSAVKDNLRPFIRDYFAAAVF